MTFNYMCPECGMETEFEFIPGEPVKHCLDHDHPEFSNPGSSDEINGPDHCETCQEPINVDRVIEKAAEKYADDDRDYTGPDTEDEKCGRGGD